MRRIFLPTKDASIYEEYYWRNTGHDEILEVGKSTHGTYAIRSLMQFDIPTISASLANGTLSTGSIFELKLFVARGQDVQIDQSIELYQVSSSWREGSGYFYQNTQIPFTASRSPDGGFVEKDGTTWKNRYTGSAWTITGSDFYTSSVVSNLVADPVVDMTFDVTSFILSWVSGTVANNGLVVKFPDADELDDTNAGNMKYFSRQTHTTYAPLLTAKWNSQVFVTGSISGSNVATATVVPKNLMPKYKKDEYVRVDLSVRERYPLKTFDTVFSNYLGNQRLPQTTYYSIVDIQSNAVIVPFDDYSRVECDGSGSYFTFHVEGMYPGRYYKLLVKSVDTTYTRIFDLGYHFTIEQV